MSVRFYTDVHVPFAITAELRIRGVDVLTAQTDNATRLDDSPLLDRATELGRVLFSRDQDLLTPVDVAIPEPVFHVRHEPHADRVMG